jgi:hypothetical protein
MARAGMATLIAELRRLVSEPSTDTYSDDLLQSALDRYQKIVKRAVIVPLSNYSGGSFTYTEYPIPAKVGQWLEENQTGSGWALRDANGNAAPSYTVNYASRLLTFASDTTGTEYYLDCRAYDLFSTAADIWEEKAAAALAPDWKSDNHDVKASQEYAMCMKRAEHFRTIAGPAVIELYRGDMQ